MISFSSFLSNSSCSCSFFLQQSYVFDRIVCSMRIKFVFVEKTLEHLFVHKRAQFLSTAVSSQRYLRLYSTWFCLVFTIPRPRDLSLLLQPIRDDHLQSDQPLIGWMNTQTCAHVEENINKAMWSVEVQLFNRRHQKTANLRKSFKLHFFSTIICTTDRH